MDCSPIGSWVDFKNNRTGNHLSNRTGALMMSPTQTVWMFGNQ
jgi:hypothetical protein